MNPDGSGLQLLYGANSHATPAAGTTPTCSSCAAADGRTAASSRCCGRSRHRPGRRPGGDRRRNLRRERRSRRSRMPACAGPRSRGCPSTTCAPIGHVARRRYASVFPLWDGTDRLLVSWTQCRLLTTSRSHRALHGEPAGGPRCRGRAAASTASGSTTRATRPSARVHAGRGRDVTRTSSRCEPRAGAGRDLRRGAGRRLDPDLRPRTSACSNIKQRLRPRRRGLAPGDITPRCAIRRRRPPTSGRPASCASRRRSACRTRTCATSATRPSAPQAARACARSSATRPIEPDGSVQVKVPANVPFAVSVLDRERAPHHAAPPQLAAAAPGRSADLQRLPRARRRAGRRAGPRSRTGAANCSPR